MNFKVTLAVLAMITTTKAAWKSAGTVFDGSGGFGTTYKQLDSTFSSKV